MKFFAILSVLVACAVAAPLNNPSDINPNPNIFEKADQLVQEAAHDAEHHASNVNNILKTIHHQLRKGPHDRTTLDAITMHYNNLNSELELVGKADQRAEDAWTLKTNLAKQARMSEPDVKLDPYQNRAIKAYDLAYNDYLAARDIQALLEMEVRVHEEFDAERKARDAHEIGDPQNPLAIEPAQPKSRSMITIMKENPGRTAIGAAIGLATLASIYAIIARRRNWSIVNATLTANSTAVPSSISVPINATKSF